MCHCTDLTPQQYNLESHKAGEIRPLVTNNHNIAEEWNLSKNIGFQKDRRDVFTTSSNDELCIHVHKDHILE